ncbi:hypothetical protein Hanom_Chr04g00357211 [Helianthus anomalus]
MRHRTTKMLDTISEDEREVSMNHETSSLSSAQFHQQASGTSMQYGLKQNQRKFPVFRN